jgi:hypothetical protein
MGGGGRLVGWFVGCTSLLCHIQPRRVVLFSNWMQITDVVKFLVAFSFAGRAFIKSRLSLSLAASLRRPNVRTRVA